MELFACAFETTLALKFISSEALHKKVNPTRGRDCVKSKNPPHGSVGMVQILSTKKRLQLCDARSAPEVRPGPVGREVFKSFLQMDGSSASHKPILFHLRRAARVGLLSALLVERI